jgi:catalase
MMKKASLFTALALSSSLLGAQTQQTKQLTTNAGAPVGDNQDSLTAGPNGGVLLQDLHLIDKLQSFDRERTSERVVHARGVGGAALLRDHTSRQRVPWSVLKVRMFVC